MSVHRVNLEGERLFKTQTMSDNLKHSVDDRIQIIMAGVTELPWHPKVTLHRDKGADQQIQSTEVVAVLDKVPKMAYWGRYMIQNESRVRVPLLAPFTLNYVETEILCNQAKGWDMDLVVRDPMPPRRETAFAIFWHRPASSAEEARGPLTNVVEVDE
jgi:hypothetical protein